MRRLLVGFVAMALLSAAPAFANSDGDKSADTPTKNGNASSTAAPGNSAKIKAAAARNESSSMATNTSTTDSAAAAALAIAPVSATVASPKAAQGDQADQSPLFFKIGGADFTPLGFLDFTSVYRSTNVGSGIGTSFGVIPFNGASPAGRLSETRFSAQNSRVGIKIDANPDNFTVTGYLEADFLGNAPPNLEVTSHSDLTRTRITSPLPATSKLTSSATRRPTSKSPAI